MIIISGGGGGGGGYIPGGYSSDIYIWETLDSSMDHFKKTNYSI